MQCIFTLMYFRRLFIFDKLVRERYVIVRKSIALSANELVNNYFILNTCFDYICVHVC